MIQMTDSKSNKLGIDYCIKTKLVWTLNESSFTNRPLSKLAQFISSPVVGSVRCVYSAQLEPHLKNLKLLLSPELKRPILMSLLGRSAVIRVTKNHYIANELVTFRMGVGDVESGNGSTIAADVCDIVLTEMDMAVGMKVGTQLSFSYGAMVCEVTELQKNAESITGAMRILRGTNLITGMEVHSLDLNRFLFPLTKADQAALSCKMGGLPDFVIVSGIRSLEEFAKIRSAFVTGESSSRHPTIAVNERVRSAEASVPPRFLLKIDSSESFASLDTVLPSLDGVFLSRSELGLSIDITYLPLIQKDIIARCNQSAKIIIVASELMYSMRLNPNPTRAEVSDVVNACADGTDGLLLSDEVTEGLYPDQVLQMCEEILTSARSLERPNWARKPFKIQNDDDAVTFGALEAAKLSGAKAIVCLTEGGYTAVRLSSQQSPLPIFAFTYNLNVARQISLCRGVHAYALCHSPQFEDVLEEIKTVLAPKFQTSDRFVFVSLSASSISDRHSNLFSIQDF